MAAAEDKKAVDVVVLDLQEITIIADYFVICSGESTPQVRAIYRGIMDDLAEIGVTPNWRSGSEEGGWVLLDYGGIVVHVFHHSQREYYDLENLWGDAKRLTPEEILA